MKANIVSQEITELVEEIQEHIRTQQIHIKHIFKEKNQLADYVAHLAINQLQSIQFNTFNQLPFKAKGILNLNKLQVPTI